MRPFDADWIAEHGALISEKFVEHMQLTLIAIALGFLISLPLSIYAHRHRSVYPYVTSITGILYTIPSLALFAFLVPYTGLSTTTAEIGLVSYTLLIFIRNIVAGLAAVPADAKEAAVGMGYTARQLLWRVEMPLALPVVIAGLRLATVTTIGLVTVSALIGKGGFGALILTGFRTFDSTPLIVGAVLSVALAIVADAALVAVERAATPWSRGSRMRAFG